jgi:GYF domain 2
MKIPSWPTWFPHPISCLRTIALTAAYGNNSNLLAKLIPISGEGIVFWVFATWLTSAASMTFYHHCLTGIFFWVAPRYPQTFPGYKELPRQFATVKPAKSWIEPNWDSSREGINALIISLVAAVITIICLILLLYTAVPEGVEQSQKDSVVFYKVLDTVAIFISFGMTAAKSNQPITEVLPQELEPLINAWFILFCLWIGSVLLLYQYDLWARRRRAAKQERRSQNSTIPTPDPVQRRVKPAKQAAPEVADWYVFRSGKAEGPYSKLQLWEVQNITARTKVRRSETGWQRAGEIPELAKYLNEK